MDIEPSRKRYSIVINKQSVIDNFMLFLLALCPILQHYNGLITNPSMEISVVVSVYMLSKMLLKGKLYFAPVIPLLLYAVFVSFIHGFTFSPFLREMLQIVLYLAVINNCLNVNRYLKICTRIALVATFLIILQYICFYLLGFHLQLVPAGFLADSAEQWLGLVRTGLIGVSGRSMNIYRPSAFFLEPSHFAIFCIPVVLVCLLSGTDNKRQIRVAALVSLGIVLSTSGIGIMAVALLWGLYGVFYYKNTRPDKKIRLMDFLKPNAMMFIIIFVVGFAVLYFSVGVFRQSVNRIFMQTDGNVTAIDGRTSTGRRALQMLTGRRFLIGYGNEISVNNWNMAGFFLVIFLHGLIGTVLFYLFYIRSLFKVKKEAFWMSLLFIGLSFFTVHTFAAYYKMYFTFIVLNGYAITSQNELSETETN